MDAAAGRLEIARAHIEQANTLLHYSTITAPFAGVVTARFVDPGAFVPAGNSGAASAIITLAEMGTLRAQVQVPESEALLVNTGQPVRVSVEGLTNQFTASVSRHSDAIDENSRTLWVEADLPNPNARLRPGMFATIRIGVERHSDALLLSSDALVIERNSTSVIVVENGRTKKTPVKLGFQDGAVAEILTGLTESAVIVRPGKSAPPEGTLVRQKESR